MPRLRTSLRIERKFSGRTSRWRPEVFSAKFLGQKLQAGHWNLGKTSMWVQTSMIRTRRCPEGAKKFRAEKLRADFSFPTKVWKIPNSGSLLDVAFLGVHLWRFCSLSSVATLDVTSSASCHAKAENWRRQCVCIFFVHASWDASWSAIAIILDSCFLILDALAWPKHQCVRKMHALCHAQHGRIDMKGWESRLEIHQQINAVLCLQNMQGSVFELMHGSWQCSLRTECDYMCDATQVFELVSGYLKCAPSRWRDLQLIQTRPWQQNMFSKQKTRNKTIK